MDRIEILSSKGIPKHYRLSSVIGKKVIAYSGEVVGKVKEMAYDMNRVVGIYVKGRTGFGKLLIGMEYIDQFHEDSVTLKINPVSTLYKKVVFDKDGKKVGRVKKIVRTSTANNFKEIIVKRGLFKKAVHIPRENMEVIAKNIILNKLM